MELVLEYAESNWPNGRNANQHVYLTFAAAFVAYIRLQWCYSCYNQSQMCTTYQNSKPDCVSIFRIAVTDLGISGHVRLLLGHINPVAAVYRMVYCWIVYPSSV